MLFPVPWSFLLTGGIVLLCDLNEYEKLVNRFEVGAAKGIVTLECV